MEAHYNAQRKLSQFFGDEPTPDTPEEVTVCLESVLNHELTRELCESIHSDIIDVIKTKLVAEHMLEMEHEYVHTLVKQGVLSPREAESLFEEIHHDSVEITKARKEKATELTKVQVLVQNFQLLMDQAEALGVDVEALFRKRAEEKAMAKDDDSDDDNTVITSNSRSGSQSRDRRALIKNLSNSNMQKSVFVTDEEIKTDSLRNY